MHRDQQHVVWRVFRLYPKSFLASLSTSLLRPPPRAAKKRMKKSLMAFLRLPCSPSSPYFSAQCHHKATLSSSFHKPPNQTIHPNNCNSGLSWSLSRTCSLPTVANKRISHFVLHFSSATQDPVLDSPSVSTPAEAKSESNGAEVEQEEYSRTRLLASNIPWTCTPEDVRSLFEKFGAVVDVELSMYDKTRNRGLAFVTMGSPEEAFAALTNLEMSEFGGRTIRMNYAKTRVKKEKASPPAQAKPPITFNLFVANLPYDATEKELKEFFAAEYSTVVSADIIFHDNPRRPSGYGFVSFKFRKDADKALSIFPGKIFKGRAIRVARSKQFIGQRTKKDSQSDDTSTESNSNVEEADTPDENQQSAEYSQSDNLSVESSTDVEEVDTSDENTKETVEVS